MLFAAILLLFTASVACRPSALLPSFADPLQSKIALLQDLDHPETIVLNTTTIRIDAHGGFGTWDGSMQVRVGPRPCKHVEWVADTSVLCRLPPFGRSAVQTRHNLNVFGGKLDLITQFPGSEPSVLKNALDMNFMWPGSVPQDGDVYTEDTILRPGVYHLPHGLSIKGDNVHLDLGGATLVGDGSSSEIGILVHGYKNVRISNGYVEGYYYGIKMQNCRDVTIAHVNASGNWRDEDGLNDVPPPLDVNVGAGAVGDKISLGGGILLMDVTRASLIGNRLQANQNGISMFRVHESVLRGNIFQDNSGWCLHLHASSGNHIESNRFMQCDRGRHSSFPQSSATAALGLSGGIGGAAILAACSSHSNMIVRNNISTSTDAIVFASPSGVPTHHGESGSSSLLSSILGSLTLSRRNRHSSSSGSQQRGNRVNHGSASNWALKDAICCPSKGNVITENIIKNTQGSGVWGEWTDGLTVSRNEMVASRDGIVLSHVSGPTLALNNTIKGCEVGIRVEHGSSITIENNLISDSISSSISISGDPQCDVGSWHRCDGSKPRHPPGSAMDVGVRRNRFIPAQGPALTLVHASHLTIVSNWFFLVEPGTAVQALDVSDVAWHSAKGGGNHWSTYGGEDLDGDGIGDTELPFTDGVDGFVRDEKPLVDHSAGGKDAEE